MLDCDGIEGFEAVYQAKGFSFFLGYAEPAWVVQGVEPLQSKYVLDMKKIWWQSAV